MFPKSSFISKENLFCPAIKIFELESKNFIFKTNIRPNTWSIPPFLLQRVPENQRRLPIRMFFGTPCRNNFKCLQLFVNTISIFL